MKRSKAVLWGVLTAVFFLLALSAALLERAEQRCGLYLAAGRAYWAGSMTMQELSALLGSRSYLSGTEDAASTGEATD